jgi:hypothetical protein
MLALVFSVSTGCKNCVLFKSTTFPAKHLLLSLLQYSVGIGTFFKDILEGLEGVLRWNLDSGVHDPVQAREVSIVGRMLAVKSGIRSNDGEEEKGILKRYTGSVEFNA